MFGEKFKKFFISHLLCTNENKFDEEFQHLLQIAYLFGFYQPKPSKGRMVYGVFMLFFILVSVVLGSIKDGILSHREGNLGKTVMNVAIAIYSSTFAIQGFKIAFCSSRLTNMVKEFHSMHEWTDEDSLQFYRKRCLWLLKFYSVLTITCMTVLVVAKLFGFNTFTLFIPAIYDSLAVGPFYYFFLCVNFIQGYCFAIAAVSFDLLHIFCVVRAEANLKFLNNSLKSCTDSGNLKRNEKDLIACVKYHWAIIE